MQNINKGLHLLVILLVLSRLEVSAQKIPFDPSTATYLWPTDASTYASASFGETRSSHFHAALDVKTWGRSGYKIFATRDGILHRVGKAPTGYGYVIYLKHDDLSYSVYAHMQAFNAQITQLVDSLRLARYQFAFDDYLEEYNIRFKQGDFLGFTGATGNGPPHLHFELRTPTHKPFNPLITNLEIKDKVAPVFSSIAFEPLELESKINGKDEIRTMSPKSRGGITDFGEVKVEGRFGIAVDVYDKADEVSNVYAAYELELFVNDRKVFASKVDSFSYGETRQMFLDRVYELLNTKNKGYQRLYVSDGNTLSFYTKDSQRSGYQLEPGRWKFTMVAKDYYGNSSKAQVMVVSEPISTEIRKEPRVVFASMAKEPFQSSEFPRSKWHTNWVKMTGLDEGVLAYAIAMDGNALHYFPQDQTLRIPLNVPESQLFQVGDKSVVLHRIIPGETTVMHSQDGRMSVHFGSTTVYDTLSLSMEHRWVEDKQTYEFSLFPDYEPLHRSAKITFWVDEDFPNVEKAAFYRYNERWKRLDYVRTTKNGNELTGYVRDFGKYQIYADTVAPRLSSPRMYRGKNNMWLISVKVVDDLSGINYSGARMFVNGVRGIAEYDYEERKLIYYQPSFSPTNENKLEVRVSDFEGNSTSETFILSR